MKNTEIITLNTINTQDRTFKDPRLEKATKRITSIYNDAAKYADAKNREIAKILADVADGKAYEKDGFKSVADYASTVFGIASQNAYALARAGKVYNDPSSHPELQAMTPSKIAELSSLDEKVVLLALSSGTINHDTTQKALREFAASVKPIDEKPIVLATYTVRACVQVLTEEQADTFKMNKTIDEWDDWFINYVASVSPDSPVEVAKLPKGRVAPDSDKATVLRTLYFNRGFSIVVEFYKYTAPKATKTPSTARFTKEQLLAMLAEMEAGEENNIKETL